MIHKHGDFLKTGTADSFFIPTSKGNHVWMKHGWGKDDATECIGELRWCLDTSLQLKGKSQVLFRYYKTLDTEQYPLSGWIHNIVMLSCSNHENKFVYRLKIKCAACRRTFLRTNYYINFLVASLQKIGNDKQRLQRHSYRHIVSYQVNATLSFAVKWID